jgi:hypothetical protein
MIYEWDERRARKNYMIKLAAIMLATFVTAGLPVYIVATAMGQ